MRILVYESVAEKPVIWLGTAREDLRAFPADARQVAGFQLWRIQRGLEPNDWKPCQPWGSAFVRCACTPDSSTESSISSSSRRRSTFSTHSRSARGGLRRDLELARQRVRMLVKQRSRG